MQVNLNTLFLMWHILSDNGIFIFESRYYILDCEDLLKPVILLRKDAEKFYNVIFLKKYFLWLIITCEILYLRLLVIGIHKANWAYCYSYVHESVWFKIKY